MKREDRVARLEALLARVRANAAARGDRPRSVLSYPPDAIHEDEEGQPPLPILVIPRAPADESTLEALSQRALALTTSDELAAPATLSVPEETWPASVRPPAAEAVAVAHDPVPDEPAPSYLERAVRDAAAEQLSPLLREAAAELRDHERRPLSEAPPPDVEADRLEAAFFADEQQAGAAAVSPERALPPESSGGHRSREPAALHVSPAAPDRGNTTLWFGAAAGAALVLGATWLFQRDPPPPIDRPPPTEVVAETPAPTPTTPSTGARGGETSAAVETSPPPVLAAPQPAIADPPDTSVLARDKGFLWVETKTGREVFVNGHAAGASGRWLEVGCGLRNVRTAQPGPPPAGASFPIWTSEGHSVLIPCRSYTRVTLPTDP